MQLDLFPKFYIKQSKMWFLKGLVMSETILQMQY